MITLTILDILIVFVVFCIAWIINNMIWKTIEGRLLLKRQNEMMDAIYAKLIRLALKSVNDIKNIREVIERDKM
jgi:hypothetical protein